MTSQQTEQGAVMVSADSDEFGIDVAGRQVLRTTDGAEAARKLDELLERQGPAAAAVKVSFGDYMSWAVNLPFSETPQNVRRAVRELLLRGEGAEALDGAGAGARLSAADCDGWILAREMIRRFGALGPMPWHLDVAAGEAGPPEGARDLRARLACRLHDEVLAFAEVVDAVAAGGQIEDPGCERDGMLWLDSLFFDHLERLGNISAEGARSGRSRARTRYQSGDEREVWKLWFDPSEKHLCHFAPMLVHGVWRDALETVLERLSKSAPRYRLRSVHVNGSDYAKVTKPASAISWSYGAGGSGVVIDGARFEAAPNVARYVSRAVAVLPDSRRPAQQFLPVDIKHDSTHLAVRALNDTQYVIDPYTGKVMLLLFITAERRLVMGSAKDLTQRLNPTKSRIQRRDYERTIESALALRSVGMVLPGGEDTQIFEIHVDRDPEAHPRDHTIQWSFTQGFEPRIRKYATALRGQFLINVTGAMSLNGNEAAELRAYLHAAALWNDAKEPGEGEAFSSRMLPVYNIENWAAETNSLSPQAAAYIDENSKSEGRRQKLYRDRKQAFEKLENLHEKGLVKIEGTKRKFQVLPTEDHLEAFQKFRDGLARPLLDD